MKRLFYAITIICLLVTGCATAPTDTAFQASTIDALLAGVYDGEMSCSDVLKHGDFGIGTFDCLDGEMIVLDSEVYQVKADGKVYRPSLDMNTPFATVCAFDADTTITVDPGTDFKGVEALVDKLAPNKNLFYAIKITGKFKAVKTRSVPGQQKPYPPLKEVTKNQPEFHMNDLSGTIVGFRCPAYVKGINVPGYHLHFLSDDRTSGGHVLSLEIAEGTCEVDMLDQYVLSLPSKGEDFGKTDLSKDRTKELHEVESDTK